ncbi:2-C-methyl-D-erythritol 4-phosphate cytidylyltransferase [Pseudonocardia broussonetiae]|uniref:2-C-methyl-D-erythritol 4-phosphate cytidylyltransferase n=1 Tax=Pseudonocardia broussonetiae TaxID=2736640 RepID=A0A6M6JSZ9_9PSEU|nr:2-C-methyl-D-erythritol 4-phosphate cytidylyltransferase [Pseudonocardia broussonetiae]
MAVPGILHVDVLVAPTPLLSPVEHAGLVSAVDAACAGLPVAVHGSVTALWAHGGQRAGGTYGDGPVTGGSCVLVHDAARPLVPVATARSVVDAVLAGHRAVVPVLPLADTVKEADERGLLHGGPDRAALRVVQTPQGFDGALAASVIAAALPDPVLAWTGAGGTVHTVPGHPLAFAVHDDWDRGLAERALAGPA